MSKKMALPRLLLSISIRARAPFPWIHASDDDAVASTLRVAQYVLSTEKQPFSEWYNPTFEGLWNMSNCNQKSRLVSGHGLSTVPPYYHHYGHLEDAMAFWMLRQS